MASADTIKCVACRENCHYWCTGLAEQEFKRILPTNLQKWKCPKCKAAKKPPTPSSSAPKSPLVLNEQSIDNNDHHPSIVSIDTEALMTSMNSKFEQLTREMNAIKENFNTKLDALSESIHAWAGKFSEIESKMENVRAEVDAVKVENAVLRGQLNVLQSNCDDRYQKSHQCNTELRTENAELRSRLNALQMDYDDMNQRSRQCNVEIQNVPTQRAENLMHIVMTLGTVLKVPISSESIRTVHRVAHNMSSDRPKNIVVELISRRLRDDIIAAARTRRDLTAGLVLDAAAGAGGAQQRDKTTHSIYVNEHLTLKKKILYSAARKEAKAKKCKYVWVKNGSILVRKADNTSVISIRTDADLAKL